MTSTAGGRSALGVPPLGDEKLDQTNALNAFLSRVQARAFRMARYATRNDDDALDLVQDAMLKLAQRYGEREEREWARLFYRILERRIVDWHRRRGVRERVLAIFRPDGAVQSRGHRDQDPARECIEQAPERRSLEPDRRLESARTIERLNLVIESLPLRQQQVFLLRAWEGLSTRDTASAVGCSPGSVKTHYSRALGAIRARLGGDLD